MSNPRVARIREDSNLGIVHQFPSRAASNEQFPGSPCHIRLFRCNVTQLCSSPNETSVPSCHTSRDFVWEQAPQGFLPFKPRGFVDTTTATTRAAGIRRASMCHFFANEAAQTDVPSCTTVCRQLRHRQLLLEFLLQMTTLPDVSDDANAKI